MTSLRDTEIELDVLAADLMAGKPIPRARIETWRKWRDEDGRARMEVRLAFRPTTAEPLRSVEFSFQASVSRPVSWELVTTSADWS